MLNNVQHRKRYMIYDHWRSNLKVTQVRQFSTNVPRTRKSNPYKIQILTVKNKD